MSSPHLPTRRVSDAPTRMFHWLLALCFAGAYLTSESERVQRLHAAFGYTMLVLLLFRLAYGWLGPRPVRWTSWLTKLRSGWAWCRSLWHAHHLPHLAGADVRAGQNLALVLVTSALTVLPVPLIWSGHLLYTGAAEWLEEMHEAMANAMLLGVVAHLLMLTLFSAMRGTNLALPMLRGRVPGVGPDLVARPRVWLALALLLLSCTLGGWAAL